MANAKKVTPKTPSAIEVQIGDKMLVNIRNLKRAGSYYSPAVETLSKFHKNVNNVEVTVDALTSDTRDAYVCSFQCGIVMQIVVIPRSSLSVAGSAKAKVGHVVSAHRGLTNSSPHEFRR